MKTIPTTALVALMSASIGLGAVAPVLAQQPAAPAAQAQPADAAPARPDLRNGPRMRQGGGMGGFGLVGIERGAEAIEIAIVRLSHAIDLTDEQAVLLEALKTDALAAAAAFDTATAGLRPAAPAEGETAAMPSITERFDSRIALESARLDALEAIQPAFAAFFDSLTDEQQAALQPDRGERPAQSGKHPGGFGQHGGGFGQRPMSPGNR